MLSAATGLVFLPSLDVDAQYQRQEATKKSGTATQKVAEEKSAVQQQVDALYARYGRPAPNGQKLPAGDTGTQNIAAKTAPATVTTAAAEGTEKADIKQVAGELAIPAPSAPAVSKSKRRFFPSLFNRKKSPPPPQVSPSSSVQEHLQKLYAKDGRPMPSMEIGKPLPLPAAPTAAAPAELPTPAAKAVPVPKPLPLHTATTPEASPEAEPIRRVSSNPFKRLIQRISPFKRKKKEQDKAKPVPAPAEAIEEQRNLQNEPLNPYYQGKDEPVAVPTPPEPQEVEPTFAEPAPLEPAELPALEAPAELPTLKAPAEKPALEEPILEENPVLEEAKPAALPEFKPLVELPETPQPELKLEAGPKSEKAAPPSLGGEVSDEPFGAEKVDPLENPFPSLSEQAADKPAEEAKPEPEKNPFTGLKLEAPAEKPAAEPKAEPKEELLLPNPTSLSPSLTKPKIVDIPQTPELPAFPTTEKPTLQDAGAPKLIIRPNVKPAPTVPEISEPAAAKPAPKRQSAAEKMKRIAERAELKGLKGFCPVQLRDERELRDARPQFSAEHDGVVYNFSSAAARQKFLAEPTKYAPASGGQDVVLASGSNKAEGSLDHAVWYRDRLYLFDSPTSMKSFKASPSKYAGKK